MVCMGFWGKEMKMFWNLDSGDSCTTLNILKTAELYTVTGEYYGM